MKFLCTSCNYVYDKSTWDREEGVEIWTILYRCPVCWEYDSFHWIEEEVNLVEDVDSPNMLEIEHIPIFNFKDNILEVRVWREPHPMWAEHRISMIALYDEYSDLVEEKFFREDDDLEAYFDISDLDSGEVRVKCTIHWIWSRKFENN